MTDPINNTENERIKRAKANGWTRILKAEYAEGSKLGGKPPIGREEDGWYDIKEIPQ